MVVMLSMNPYIDYSVAVMSTARGFAFARFFSDCCLTYFGSKVMCGELIFYLYQDLSLSR